MTALLNLSVAVQVPAAEGVRLDVQRESVAAHPALLAYEVHPVTPVHDCGPNGVRLWAPDLPALMAAAPAGTGVWDVWLDPAAL